MMMKKVAFLALVVILSSFSLNAQEYRTAFGVRGGFYNGLSLKRFVTNNDAIEAVVATHYRGLLISGMYQIHTLAFDVPGLYWYYGGGAHLGFYNQRDVPWFQNQTGNITTLGVLGVVGIEYKIDEIPITIGFDVTPALNIIGHTGPWINAGIVIRYTF
jgi:hypothetical protein